MPAKSALEGEINWFDSVRLMSAWLRRPQHSALSGPEHHPGPSPCQSPAAAGAPSPQTPASEQQLSLDSKLAFRNQEYFRDAQNIVAQISNRASRKSIETHYPTKTPDHIPASNNLLK